MKKMLMAACLSLVAFVLVPVASASANDWFKGKCEIQGRAEFGVLSFATEEIKPFKFKSKVETQGELTKGFAGGKEVKCEGEGHNEAKNETKSGVFSGKAEVNTAALGAKVEGELSCSKSKSKAGEPAKTHITFEKGAFTVLILGKLHFKTSKFGELELTLLFKGGNVKGVATFTEPGNEAEKAANAEKCASGTLTELPFDAVFPSNAPNVKFPEFSTEEPKIESE